MVNINHSPLINLVCEERAFYGNAEMPLQVILLIFLKNRDRRIEQWANAIFTVLFKDFMEMDIGIYKSNKMQL